MSRTLATLLRLRRLEVEAARRSLADMLAAETRAEQALADAQAALLHETLALDRAALIPLKNFAAWLPYGAATRNRAERALSAASLDVETARTGLASRQGALRAAEVLADADLREARRLATRLEAHRLDDVFRGGKVRKRFFFEKKNQKTLDFMG